MSRILGEDEEVLVDLRPHWLFLSGPLASTMVAVAVAIAVTVEFPKAPIATAYVLAVMVAAPILWLGIRTIKWLGVSLVITNERVIYRRGVFGRDVIQLRIQRITEVHCSQTLWGRMLGAGELIVELQGGDPMVIADVGHPRVVQRVLNDQLTQISHGALLDGGGTRASGVPTDPVSVPRPLAFDLTPPHGISLAATSVGERSSPPPSASASLHDQLIQLDDLRRRGILSNGEFQAKKAELLSRL
ncbi:MAG TPA: PH domain-containing protein [Acidimicrobiales bacterium]|nr:PH domain-containing protein [Acidimicrobiales bacterium]